MTSPAMSRALAGKPDAARADDADAETQPLVRALNRLLNRLETALDNERRFTADAAHELRTPLAALKIHAQVAMATSEPAQCKQAVTKVIAGADQRDATGRGSCCVWPASTPCSACRIRSP